MSISDKAIVRGLKDLDLTNQAVEVHSSLSSFGYVAGRAQSVISALLNVCSTTLMPTFSEIGRTIPPPGDRPPQNGTDYENWLALAPDNEITPFDSDTFGCESDIDEEMGVVPWTFLKQPETQRSKHPSVSWSAAGKDADYLSYPHPPDDPNVPLKRSLERNGRILLLGVPLSKCTAIHLAEELSGRRPFIRWTLYTDGRIRRIREYGCSDGFSALEPFVRHLAQTTQIGECEATTYPIREFVELCSLKIDEDPWITVCPKRCERCLDAVRGGPKD